MGDSLATGYLATAGYVSQYHNYLQTDTAVNLTLYNLGQNGWSSASLLNALQTDSVFHSALLQSEVVTWDVGLNDFKNARLKYKSRKCGGKDNQACLRSVVMAFKGNWDGIIREGLMRRSLLPYAQVYAAFNGGSGSEDPIAKGLVGSDGLHPTDARHKLIADLLRGLGYAPLR